jgi:phosphoglycerol transferase MdoB-like AlkP superfamily enzyme
MAGNIKLHGDEPESPGHSRFGFLRFQAWWLIVLFTLVRVVLFLQYKPAPGLSVPEFVKTFLVGLHLDVTAAAVLSLPWLLWLALAPGPFFQWKPHRFLFLALLFVFWFVETFLLIAEYYFFDEFKSRFNTVAIDYLLYPKEVSVNIWDTYPIPVVVASCVALAAFLVWRARGFMQERWETPCSFASRLGHLAAGLALAAALWFFIGPGETRFSPERVVNEIADNGMHSVALAFWSRNLDYAAFYPTMPRAEAYERARRLLAEPAVEFEGKAVDSIQRRLPGDAQRPRLNVVMFLEESLGSEFWGSLGRRGATLLPQMDKLAAEEGILFTNLYATGNRTVRGFEGVLASFPPLPGDSIVKRDRTDNVETIARVLKRDGYDTVFFYGGRGFFDGMRSFAVRNGYDRFVEQKDFATPTFATVWGVCNEDLYRRALEEFRALATNGRPFFATLLSVSNHKPFTYPAGRIPEDPNERRRENAVKYTDWALGEFFKAARKEPFYTNTVFVVVADHGARVYGSERIPIHSYEIPMLVAGPAVVKAPARIGEFGCQLDVAPTILGLLGRPYRSMFFGRDLLKSKPDDGRALLHHNRDVGVLKGDRLVVLSMNKGEEFYKGNPRAYREDSKTGGMVRLAQPDAVHLELKKDAVALFQVADDLYMNRKYRMQEPPPSNAKR